MKVALVSAFLFDDSIGGVENHIRFMTKEFGALGHEILIFKPVWSHEETRASATIDGCNIRFVQLGKKPYEIRRLSSSGSLGYVTGFIDKATYALRADLLARHIAAWQPDLVWQHDFSSSWLAARKLSRDFPVVLTNHTGEYLMLRNQPWGQPLLRRLLEHYSAIIGPSTELTPNFLQRAYTVHNGVDTRLFSPVTLAEKQNLKRSLFGHTDRFVVFCPRRWAPTKGILYLAHAIRELNRQRSELDFLFVFAGNDYYGFPQYIAEVDAQLRGMNNVVKLGNLGVDQIASYYSAADLVVIPSLMEAVSLAALEAMASGTPVLATHVGGMPEVIIHGENGYLVPPKDAGALAEKIRYISEDENYTEVARAALQMVRQKYSWRAVARQTEAILHSVYRAQS